jgi:amidohydrolase
VVAYRADIDAVVTNEPDPAPFRSETPGVRHICGHDVHTAVALGVAEAFTAVRDEIPGTLVLLFQPAEESGVDLFALQAGTIGSEATGALAMIREGALDRPRPAAIFAVHTAPLATGQVGAVPGIALAGADRVVVRLSGAGDRQKAAEVIRARIASLHTLPPREQVFASGATQFGAFVETGLVRSAAEGEAWVLAAYVRASTEEGYAKARAAIQDVVRNHGVADVEAKLDYADRIAPDVRNDAALVQAAAEPLRSVLGPDGALIGGGAVPYFGEDFAFYQQRVPGVLFWLGVSRAERGIIGVPHAPFYQADDDAIPLGARAMSRVLLQHLESHAR